MTEEKPPLNRAETEEERREEKRIRLGIRDAEATAFADIVASDRTPEGVLGAIENAVGFAEVMTEKMRHPETPPVACCAGCSWCCYQMVSISAPEAFKLARFIQTLPAEEANNLVARLRRLDNETHGATATLRDKLRLPCAFLVDKQCSVYFARPLECAEFTSFDVKACERAHRWGYDKVEIIHEKARLVVFQEVLRGVFQGLSRLKPPVENGPLELTAAVLTVLDTPDCETRWLAGEPVFAKAHLATEPADALRGPREDS